MLTQARTTNTFGNQIWGPSSGQYNFDANGAPAVGGNNLTYGLGDLKKRQVVNVIQVKDTWGTGQGFYDFDAGGAPVAGGNNLTYGPAGDKKRTSRKYCTSQRYVGTGESGQYSFDANWRPSCWWYQFGL